MHYLNKKLPWLAMLITVKGLWKGSNKRNKDRVSYLLKQKACFTPLLIWTKLIWITTLLSFTVEFPYLFSCLSLWSWHNLHCIKRYRNKAENSVVSRFWMWQVEEHLCLYNGQSLSEIHESWEKPKDSYLNQSKSSQSKSYCTLTY